MVSILLFIEPTLYTTHPKNQQTTYIKNVVYQNNIKAISWETCILL